MSLAATIQAKVFEGDVVGFCSPRFWSVSCPAVQATLTAWCLLQIPKLDLKSLGSLAACSRQLRSLVAAVPEPVWVAAAAQALPQRRDIPCPGQTIRQYLRGQHALNSGLEVAFAADTLQHGRAASIKAPGSLSMGLSPSCAVYASFSAAKLSVHSCDDGRQLAATSLHQALDVSTRVTAVSWDWSGTCAVATFHAKADNKEGSKSQVLFLDSLTGASSLVCPEACPCCHWEEHVSFAPSKQLLVVPMALDAKVLGTVWTPSGRLVARFHKQVPRAAHSVWDPSSSRIAFHEDDEKWLQICNVRTGHCKVVALHAGVVFLTWSPDSRFLAYSWRNEYLELLNASGQHLSAVNMHDTVWKPVWGTAGLCILQGDAPNFSETVSVCGVTRSSHLDVLDNFSLSAPEECGKETDPSCRHPVCSADGHFLAAAVPQVAPAASERTAWHLKLLQLDSGCVLSKLLPFEPETLHFTTGGKLCVVSKRKREKIQYLVWDFT